MTNKSNHRSLIFFSLGIVLIVIISALFFSELVMAASNMECIDYNGDPTIQHCFEFKSQLYNSTVPIINVTFMESVQIDQTASKLYRIGEIATANPEDPFKLDQTYSSTEILMKKVNGTNSSYMPERHVNDGLYLFRMSAFNVPNINIEVAVVFRINGTSMDFWVTSPSNKHITTDEKLNFAVSNNSIFYLEIEGKRQIEQCKFTPYSYGINSNTPLAEAFANITTYSFTTNSPNNLAAHISNFNISEYYQGYNYNGDLRLMYIICIEPQGKYSYGEIGVGVDKSSPIISLNAVPNPVVDASIRRSNLTISTDDKSACTITQITNNQLANGLPIINRNSQYNFKYLSEFSNIYTEQFLFNSEPNPFNYVYNVTCDNLANLRSSQIYVINVNLSLLQSFEFYSPSRYISTPSVFVNGSANIGSGICTATLNKTSNTGVISLSKIPESYVNGRRVYSGTIPSVPEGTNKIYVNCTYMGPGVFSEQSFTVDRTKPATPNITLDENTCSLSKITATAKSSDNISGIKKYTYNLTLDGDTNKTYAISGTSSNGKISVTIKGTKIEGRVYTLKVWAEDDAGNIGVQSIDTIKVTDDSLAACDKTSPIIKINKIKNNVTNEWKVWVNCTDYESGCLQSFSYSLETNSSAVCIPKISTGLGTPISVIKTSVFCAVVFDNNKNNDSEKQTLEVTYPINCLNKIKDGDESGIDCGGKCQKCLLNETCRLDSDCALTNCVLGVCANPACTDKKKNGFESGIDCGGINCLKCEFGGICLEDNDCSSKNCAAGKCAVANCTDNKKDGSETDVDCGGNCNKCTRGKSCEKSTDCTTNYCDSAGYVCGIDPLLDTDGDGLPDIWEEKYCGTNIACNPNEDTDGDGYTNLEEFEAGTNPLDPESYPDFKKYNLISIILLIIGALMIIAGIIIKVMDVLDEKKQNQAIEEKEMTGTLSQIPKLSSVQPVQERKLTEEELMLRQDARNKNLKLKEFEKRKVLNQFSTGNSKLSEDTFTNSKLGDVKPAELKVDSAQKKEVVEKTEKTNQQTSKQNSKKYLDSDSKEEYLDLSNVKINKKEDVFSKLKESLKDSGKTSPKSSSKEVDEKTSKKKEEKVAKDSETIKKTTKKSKDDEVFTKLKNMTSKNKK